MNAFGFGTEGDVLPLVKYDARAGRIVRIDRILAGGAWVTKPVDITAGFRAAFDLENLETGFIDFNTGGAPAFALVRIGDPLPRRPTANAKNGIRVRIRLGREAGGDRPIRAMASTARAFLQGMEELYGAFRDGRDDHPGEMPVAALAGTVPVIAGFGDRQSTNYRPVFTIVQWVPRGVIVLPKSGVTRGEARKAPVLADARAFG